MYGNQARLTRRNEETRGDQLDVEEGGSPRETDEITRTDAGGGRRRREANTVTDRRRREANEAAEARQQIAAPSLQPRFIHSPLKRRPFCAPACLF